MIDDTRHLTYLGLGSNLGDRAGNIERAIHLISERVGTVVRQSSLIETEPWGFESENRFLNGVVLCETQLSPRRLLRVTQQVERTMGRRKSVAPLSSDAPRRYKDRIIDIDILLYDDVTVDEPDLKIPHPLMKEREFVMKPLQEIQKKER